MTTDISVLIHAATARTTPLRALSAVEKSDIYGHLTSAALGQEFYTRDAATVARELLGKILVRSTPQGEFLSAFIAETEAYLHENDEASHSARGKKPRNRSMFAVGGTLYVYKIYGIHYCINAVAGERDEGSAVLIRAAIPFAGIDYMQKRRGADTSLVALCRGPGNLARAFGFTTNDDGISLCSPEVFIAGLPDDIPCEICVSSRIGITKSAGLPLRFYVNNSPFVSGKKQR